MSIKPIFFLQHVDNEPPGRLQTLCSQARHPFRIIRVDQSGIPEIAELTQARAVISLGGPMNVYESARYPFLKTEIKAIQALLQKRVPFLGVCLGAQLLCVAGGGHIYKAASPEIGWTNIAIEPNCGDALFAELPATARVLQIHQDACELPTQSKLLAHNETCIQAFRIGSSAWGLQFHVEAGAEMISSWYEKKVAQEILREYIIIQKEISHTCDILFSRFLQLAQTTREASSS